ncbi:hypothetical protein [Evansella halocellulosilytica]|uniref:hypothetical protein n=1 Tax=Evansella halocellulosilytica TaxID=2011013 RepID=UPI000BB779C3|nr:hypothetical protein [Evansella halocellulosilytica]
MWWKQLKGPLILFTVLIAALYSILSYHTYRSIEAKSIKIEALQEEVERSDEISSSKKASFNRELENYERLQSLLQSFWMKWVFDFPEFNPIE